MIPSFSKKKKKKIQRRKSAMQRPNYLTNHVNKFTKSQSYIFHIQLNRRYTDMFTR